MIQYIFLALFFFDVIIHMVGVVKEHKNLIYITKPILMPLLALYFIFGTLTNNFDWLIVVALLWGGAGDTFLMLENKDKWFMYGMAAFLLGHVFYILSFLLSIGVNIIAFPLWGLILFAPVIVIILFTFPKFKNYMGDLKIPVYVYMGAILTMHISAVLRLSKFELLCPCFFLVWIGSILFILSDSLIAIDTFNKEIKIPYMKVYIILTYVLAQFLIIQGVLLIGVFK